MDVNHRGYIVSADQRRVDSRVVHRFLCEESYWARNIGLDVVERAIKGSFCVAALRGNAQVGFARVVTDGATYGHLMDVFVLPEHRGRGLAKAMLQLIMQHPELQGFRLWTLGTADAHPLYEQFGFTAPRHPERWMEKRPTR